MLELLNYVPQGSKISNEKKKESDIKAKVKDLENCVEEVTTKKVEGLDKLLNSSRTTISTANLIFSEDKNDIGDSEGQLVVIKEEVECILREIIENKNETCDIQRELSFVKPYVKERYLKIKSNLEKKI